MISALGPFAVTWVGTNLGNPGQTITGVGIYRKGGDVTDWVATFEDAEYDPVLALSIARLFAAAPEMLAICKEFVARVERGEVRSVKTYGKMKEVIRQIEDD